MNDIIRYTATSKVTPYRASSLPTIISNDFDKNTGQGVIKFETDVINIGNVAFRDCIDLTSVTIPNSVTSIGDYAFYYCIVLTSVTIPNSVTSIGRWAFAFCPGLTSVTIGNSVTSIGNCAFENCNSLTSITIPDSVTSIERFSFYGCRSLTSIIVENGNTIYDSRDNCNAIIETATNMLIQGCKNTIEIPNSVTSIGNVAFSDCRGLTSVTIPNSVTSIGDEAFSACSGLTSMTIPNSVTSIGDYAFSNCTGLTAIVCESINPPTIYSKTWNNVNKSIPLYVPAESVSAYQQAEYWSEFTNIQAIPEN